MMEFIDGILKIGLFLGYHLAHYRHVRQTLVNNEPC